MVERVWYAGYGSNLSRERFLCYLRGGRPPGGARVYRGCADRRAPSADVAATLPFGLYFAGASTVWGGGIAFVDPRATGDSVTLARLWLVTRGQFTDLVAQENHVAALRLPARHGATGRLYVCGSGRYGAVLHCGQRDGRAVLTVTSPDEPGGRALAAPRPAYVRAMVSGLRETHGLAVEAALEYLLDRPGVRGQLGRDDLLTAVGPSPTRGRRSMPPASVDRGKAGR